MVLYVNVNVVVVTLWLSGKYCATTFRRI